MKDFFLNVDVISLICSPQMMGDDTWPGFITCFQCLGLPIIVDLSYKLYFCKRRISNLKGQSSHFELQLQCKNTVAVSELAHRRTWSVPGSILSQCLDIWTTLTRQDKTTLRHIWDNAECVYFCKYKYKYKIAQTRTWSVSVLHFPVLPPSSKTAVDVV